MKVLETIKRHSKSKESVDFFETQDSTIDILYNNFLKEKLDFNSLVADFSCGKGAILNNILKKKPSVARYGSDIVRQEDFFCEVMDMFKVDKFFNREEIQNYSIHITMNPPFNKLTETMDYYLQLKKKYPNIKSLSLLHSTRSLEGIARHKIMEQHGYPNLILNMTKRQSFNTYFENNEKRVWTPTFSCVWSIWDDRNYNRKTEFKYIKG